MNEKCSHRDEIDVTKLGIQDNHANDRVSHSNYARSSLPILGSDFRHLKMLPRSTIVMLAKYNDWADKVLFTAIEQLPASALYRERRTLFKTMIGTLNHNYQVDLIWRAHLQSQEHGYHTRKDLLHPDFEGLVNAQLDINKWYIQWAESAGPDEFLKQSDFNFVSGASGRMSSGNMFLHIINHKTYHRGWVSQMFFDHGVNPPETDICVFLCEE